MWIAICGWITKFLSGFAIWKGQQLGKFLWVAIISLVVVFSFWKIFLQKEIVNIERTTIGKGSTVNYHYHDCSDKVKEDAVSLLKLWKLRLICIK